MKKNKIFPLLLLVVMLLSPLPVFSQDGYQYTVGGAYSNTDYDGGAEMTMLMGAFQLYTSPISYLDGPYAEAGFLNRQSSLALSIGTVELDANIGVLTPSLEGTNLIVGFQYADQSTPFIFGVLYNQADADDTVSNAKLEFTIDVLGFQLGYYLTDRSRLAFAYTQTDLEFLGNGNSLSKLETDEFELSFRNLSYLARNHFAGLSVGAAYIDNDADEQNTEFNLAADYYFARTFSVGAGIGLNTGDDVDDEGATMNINASVFVSPMASIGVEYEQFSADEADNDEETLSLAFAIRF
jgi:hypothetical protein